MQDDPQSTRLRVFAKRMRAEPTHAERKLWLILRARRLSGFKFRRQVPLGLYIADFVCFEQRLIVEADGSQHGESARDATRDALADGAGAPWRRRAKSTTSLPTPCCQQRGPALAIVPLTGHFSLAERAAAFHRLRVSCFHRR